MTDVIGIHRKIVVAPLSASQNISSASQNDVFASQNDSCCVIQVTKSGVRVASLCLLWFARHKIMCPRHKFVFVVVCDSQNHVSASQNHVSAPQNHECWSTTSIVGSRQVGPSIWCLCSRKIDCPWLLLLCQVQRCLVTTQRP